MPKHFKWRKSKPAKEQPLADPNQNAADQYKRQISGDLHVRGEVEANLPPSLIEKYETTQQKETTHKQKIFIVEVATMGAVIIYAGIAIWQACLTREALRISRDSITTSAQQFEQDQRPYVWMAPSEKGGPFNIELTQSVEHPGYLNVRVAYRNYGKSPAIIEKGGADIEIGPDAIQNLSFLRVAWESKVSVLPPSKDDWITDFSREPYDSGLNAPENIAVFYRIRYHALNGHPYETLFCFRKPAGSGPWEYCPSNLGFNRLIDCKTEKCND